MHVPEFKAPHRTIFSLRNGFLLRFYAVRLLIRNLRQYFVLHTLHLEHFRSTTSASKNIQGRLLMAVCLDIPGLLSGYGILFAATDPFSRPQWTRRSDLHLLGKERSCIR
ncbi:uncharacterized protein LOC130769906 [Actinidia eriantha]|uniref:uncharacterized protein LOC130769906 n=1 Tax=Actinidia eriantha TaxID=165200 RepID=UPI00258BC16F|nr:uncharacterized protein LOC130769906 [Actinidia eriantha]